MAGEIKKLLQDAHDLADKYASAVDSVLLQAYHDAIIQAEVFLTEILAQLPKAAPKTEHKAKAAHKSED